MDLPAIFLPAGPMLAGRWRDRTPRQRHRRVEVLGRTQGRQSRLRARWRQIEDGIARSPGTCMTMGTASTMASITEALGMTPAGRGDDSRGPLGACAHGRRRRAGAPWISSGRTSGRRMILTADAFRNAVVDRHGARAGRPTRSSTSSRWRAARVCRSPSRTSTASRAKCPSSRTCGPPAVPDGGLPRCGRRAGAAVATARPPGPRLPHRDGRHARRRDRERGGVVRRRHSPRRSPAGAGRRHVRAARQPRAGRLRDQTDGGRAPPAHAHGTSARLCRLRRPQGPHRSRRPRGDRRSRDRAAERRDRSARPACRSGACCRSRRSC